MDESVQDLERLRNKYVAVGDLAAVVLTRGRAETVELASNGYVLYIEGRLQPDNHVSGFWKLPTWRRKFSISLPLVSEGFWGTDDAYVKVGREAIEVVAYGKTYVSRPNICGIAESAGSRQDQDVVVHIVGTLRRASAGLYYTAFRCSDFYIPLAREPLFSRFAFRRRFRGGVAGRGVEFREIFVKSGVITKVFTNLTCREYAEVVYKLYGFFVECRS